MVTASGITFIAATSDYYLRAFNTVTGEELAKYRLPTGGHAVPMSYTGNDGKQFVVIAAGGHWAMLRSVLEDVSLATIFKGVTPFWMADIVRLALLIAFPPLSLWLVMAMS